MRQRLPPHLRLALPAESSAVSAPPRGSAPDLVRLKDGSLFRGTIAELVVGDHVIIVTLAGESRRFAMADVEYAGRAQSLEEKKEPDPDEEEEEAAPPPRRQRAPTSVKVSFQAKTKSTTTLHVVAYMPSSAAPEPESVAFRPEQPLCAAPCETGLPVGKYRFGVGGESGHVERVPTIFEVTAPTALQGSYHDNHETRAAGWGILALSGLLGTTLVALGTVKEDKTMVIAGGLGGVVGMGFGLALGLQFDSAEVVTVSPDAALAE